MLWLWDQCWVNTSHRVSTIRGGYGRIFESQQWNFEQDFGWCAKISEDQKRSTFCGTLDYAAPEMLGKKPSGKKGKQNVGEKGLARKLRKNNGC